MTPLKIIWLARPSPLLRVGGGATAALAELVARWSTGAGLLLSWRSLTDIVAVSGRQKRETARIWFRERGGFV